MSSTFSWLHLSDLHVRSSTKWDADSVTAALVDDIRMMVRENHLHIDALFFTGDAAFGNDEGESLNVQYKAFGSFLEEVRKACDPILDKSRIFIVPGNHDVDRKQILESDTEWLRNSKRTQKEITDALRKGTPMCRQWMKRLDSYRQFLIEYGLDQMNYEEPSLIWCKKLYLDKATISIAGLNSAWSCATNNEKAALWMAGEWQISELGSRLGTSDLSIALIHHPSNWLNESEDPMVGRLLDQKFDIILHGHEHKEFILQDSQGNLKISAGACYDRNDHLKGYSIGSMSVDGSGGKLWLRTWDEIGRGWVAKNIAVKAPTGCYQIKPLERAKSIDGASNGVTIVTKDDQIINVSGRLSADVITSKKSLLRRRPFGFQAAHSRVRVNERIQFEEALSNGGIAWLTADWQMGKDGFIGSVLNSIGSTPATENVYRIDCGVVSKNDEIFDDAGSQLGVTFVEFAELVNHIEQATLVLEDVPAIFIKNQNTRLELLQKLKTTIDFAPSLRIIVTGRQWPERLDDPTTIVLKPLDGPDLLRYLNAHPDGKELLKRRDRIEDVLAHTGGLPSSIDRLISKSNVLPLDELLDDHTSIEVEEANEKIPKTLESAVDRVFSPQSEDERRKLSLLKLMTVLKDGETFDGLRRAVRGKPFRSEHLLSLAEDGLIESIPIAKRATSLIPTTTINKSTVATIADRLLRVPRQVRDYVDSRIPRDERSRIYNAVSEALFGARWYEGKVKIRRAIVLAYRESTVAGPGSELLVAQYLLKSAIDRGSKDRIDKYARLAVNYCTELIENDRFRDGMIASRAMLSFLNEDTHPDAWIDCAYAYGRAARMTSHHQESIDILEKLLAHRQTQRREFIALIHLNLAWCFEKLARNEDSVIHAKLSIEHTHNESDTWFQATAVGIKVENGGVIPENICAKLYVRARNLGHHSAANNIALDWARNSTSRVEATRLLDDVISNAKDLYNQTRAIVDKANLLRRSNRIGELTSEEQLRLCNAYEYSCAQRISPLLDSCHDALWDFCVLKGFLAGMFRLFRFSSFVWCLTDRTVKENEYMAILVAARQEPEKINEIEVDSELEYLDRRLHSQSDTQ